MTRWLITGASGFVGSRLVADLEARPSPCVDTLLTPRRAELDLADAAAVGRYLETHRVTGIVHLAAALGRASTPEATARQWRDTFEAGRIVVDQAVTHQVRHLILAGSVDELGDQDGVLGTEREPRPHSLYGLCKTLVRECASFAARRAPLRVDWFRPFVVYGPGQTGEMLIPSAFQAATAAEPCDFTDGQQRRDFVFIDDVVAWIRLALGLPSESGTLHLHHLGTAIATPVCDVIGMIREEFPDARFRLGVRPRRPGEPMTQVAPPYVAREPAVASWSAATPLHDGIRRTAAWWRACGAVAQH